jgi:predicted aspartyl protease
VPCITKKFAAGAEPTVEVDILGPNGTVRAAALLDTGAEISGISDAVAASLGLKNSMGTALIQGATGNRRTNTYAVDLDFAPAGLNCQLKKQRVFEIPSAVALDMIVGRDIICFGSAASELTLGPGLTFRFCL